MKTFFASLCLAVAAALFLPVATARAQSGILLKTFDIRASRLLLDPDRPRLYTLLPRDSGVAVIDTNTNSVSRTITVDPNPVDLSISPDGTKLYVVSNGSSQTAINVIDLQSLTLVARLPLPVYTTAIAAGLGGRLYAVVNTGGPYAIEQLDATTGVAQGYVARSVDTGYLRLSPDSKTLYYANSGVTDQSYLESFDVSTQTPYFVRENDFNNVADNGEGLAVSHNGNFLVFPIGTGNGTGGIYTTSLLSATNINTVLGTFQNGAYPGPATFSADDSLLYQVRFGTQSIQIFSTSDFSLVGSFNFPHNDPIDIAVTAPHGYVYVSGEADDFSGAGPLRLFSSQPAPFFDGSVALTGGFYYLEFSTGVPFGYYSFASSPYLYHDDLGFEYPIDAADGSGGIYLYDFTSKTFWYTSSSFFPYLYDFTLNAFLYYYPDPTNPDHYNTNGVRYFYNFSTGKIIKKMSASSFHADARSDGPDASTSSRRDCPSFPGAPSPAQMMAAFCWALLLVVLSPAPCVRAQSGLLLRTFNVKAEKLLLDPGRPRLYATLPEDNGIAVIDTVTNSVVTTLPIGQSPVAMAISPDGARLYVANANTTTQAITVVDLNALATLTSLPAPFKVAAVAAGAGNRLYVLTSNGDWSSVSLAQIDATTGQLQTTFGPGVTIGPKGFLQISPDLTTLYCGGMIGNSSSLAKFDVSTATPGAGQSFPYSSFGGNGQSLVLSHDGQSLVYANGSGNLPNTAYETLLYSTANFGAYLGVFDIGAYSGPATFSKDDSVFAEVQLEGGRGDASVFKLFDRATFTLRDSFLDPAPPSTQEGYFISILDLVITSPNGYLYYTRTADDSLSSPGYLRMASTQVSPFFDGATALSSGFYYLKFTDGVPFGYYNLNLRPYVYHLDLGFEYPIDAADGNNGIFLYDFTSSTFWYTSSSIFPYLYDFTLNAWLYYYPDPTRSDRYNTDGVRYFLNFSTGKIISK